MGRDEHEMLVEYSEMTAFNFNSKEFLEVKEDYIECKNVATGFDGFMKNFIARFKSAEAL